MHIHVLSSFSSPFMLVSFIVVIAAAAFCSGFVRLAPRSRSLLLPPLVFSKLAARLHDDDLSHTQNESFLTLHHHTHTHTYMHIRTHLLNHVCLPSFLPTSPHTCIRAVDFPVSLPQEKSRPPLSAAAAHHQRPSFSSSSSSSSSSHRRFHLTNHPLPPSSSFSSSSSQHHRPSLPPFLPLQEPARLLYDIRSRLV